MALEYVSGKNVGKIVLYALSTCPWCNKTKKLLNDLGVDYYYANVDLLGEEEKAKVMNTVEKWNPSCSFPTMVINDSKCIIGFQEDEIRKALKL
jgi:glutaredoxin-like protein NrdH